MLNFISMLLQKTQMTAKGAVSAAINSADTRRTVIDESESLRVEPQCSVSKDLYSVKELGKVRSLANDLFSSYHMIAISSMMSVNGASISKTLDTLNPRKSLRAFTRAISGTESMSLMDEDSCLAGFPNIAMSTTESIGGYGDSSAYKDSPISKIVDTSVSENGEKFVLPIAYTLTSIYLDPTGIVDLMAFETGFDSLKERHHKYKSRGGSYVKDLLIAKDIMNKRKRMMMGDSGDLYQEAQSQASKSHLHSILSGSFNPVSTSNIFIISAEVARMVEKEMRGPISDASIRKKIFDNSMAVMIIIVDTEWDSLTVWYNAINGSSETTLSSMGKKEGGSDVMALFKSLRGGNAAII